MEKDVVLLLGYRAQVTGDLTKATRALQKAIGAQGKKWKRVAPGFVFLAAGDAQFVGFVLGAVPQHFEAPSNAYFDSPLATTHPLQAASLKSPAVDDYTEAIAGLVPALKTFEVTLEALRPGSLSGDERTFLISRSGVEGTLMLGVPLLADSAKAAAPLEEWSFTYDSGTARLGGLRVATVNAAQPVVTLPTLTVQEQLERKTRLVADLNAMKWPTSGLSAYLLGPTATGATATTSVRVASVSTTFAARSWLTLGATFDVLRPDSTRREQKVDGLDVLAFGELAKWLDGGVHEAVLKLAAEPEWRGDVQRLLRNFPLQLAIGTWNAHVAGRWSYDAVSTWLEVELRNEQGDDAVKALLGVVRTSDGWVVVTWPTERRDELQQLFDFDFFSEPSKWQPLRAWFGEGAG